MAMGANWNKTASVFLDYRDAATKKLLGNISAAVRAGEFLWTASDEGRTIECLAPHRRGFRLREQVRLDDVFARLAGAENGDEADIEALSVNDGYLWVCGSHCRVRLNRTNDKFVDSRLRSRESRCVLGAVKLQEDGGGLATCGMALPGRGAGSLRQILRKNRFIKPFIDLPSKENGLDIEGLCVTGRRLFLGLRGPVVDSIALVMEMGVSSSAVVRRSQPVTHFLDLRGLGVRDLTMHGEHIVVLAGPVSAADGPFRLYLWRPRRTKGVQHPHLLKEWTDIAEHPEGVCVFSRKGKKGLLIVFDTPEAARLKKSRYRADWIAWKTLKRESVSQ